MPLKLTLTFKLVRARTKQVFRVNLSQISSEIPKISTESPFLYLITFTFHLDIQTHPSEKPNTSSLWIWRKSVQRFPRYFIHKHVCLCAWPRWKRLIDMT